MIDILLATYNGEKYIKDLMDSILDQTYDNFRLIISDDNSQDRTVSIIEEYKHKDRRISLHKQKVNQGIIKNFEFLLNKSSSPFIAYCDQDDIWLENKLEISLEFLKKSKKTLVHTDLIVTDENLNCISNSMLRDMKLVNKHSNGETFIDYLHYNRATGCTILFKSDLKIFLLPFLSNSCILHDWWTALNAYKLNGIKTVNVATILYRQHTNNSVGYKPQKKFLFDKINRNIKFLLNGSEYVVERHNFYCSLYNERNHFNRNEFKFITLGYNIFENIYNKKSFNTIHFHHLYKSEGLKTEIRIFIMLVIYCLKSKSLKLMSKS